MRFSKKLAEKIETPLHAGRFTAEEAQARGMRLAVGVEGEIAGGCAVAIYLLVDEEDGVIADAQFQAFGGPALIGAAEVACELLLRKTYDQAQRISADLLDRHARDRKEAPAFPEAASIALNSVLAAIDAAAAQCTDIPFADSYAASPLAAGVLPEGRVAGWEQMSVQQQVRVLEEVIAAEVRPYIALDEGGVQVLTVVGGREVVIAYQGSCTSCYAATGSTLTAIQQILRAKVNPELIVTPDPSFLHA
jgi:NifU-like protein